MSIVTAQHIASHVAFCARLSPAQAEEAIAAIGAVILHQIQHGHTVQIEGFGLFEKGERSDGTVAIRFRQAKKVREALER